MPYIKKQLSSNGKKAFVLLMRELGLSMQEAQRFIDKKRLFCNDILVEHKNQILNGKIELISYVNVPNGDKPIFDNEYFAIFEKRSGILTHPNGRNCKYSLCDEIWSLYGHKASVAHRLDKETSGLILVAKDKNTQIILKNMFAKQEIKKEYIALVQGKINDKFSISAPIYLTKDEYSIKTRMQINPNGKIAKTNFIRLEYFDNLDISLVLCQPLTGRQHQIRLHLYHIGHKILGEYLYGLDDEGVKLILDKKISDETRIKITGAKRLCLHSNSLEFNFDNKNYKFVSNINIKEEFLKSINQNVSYETFI